jgi:mRNA interferase HigB
MPDHERRMRVIKREPLVLFWTKYPDAETGLAIWYKRITSKHWASPNEIMANFTGTDQVGNGRIVFDIGGNKYRLIVFFRYDLQIAYVRFVGTHAEYDRIKDIQHI